LASPAGQVPSAVLYRRDLSAGAPSGGGVRGTWLCPVNPQRSRVQLLNRLPEGCGDPAGARLQVGGGAAKRGGGESRGLGGHGGKERRGGWEAPPSPAKLAFSGFDRKGDE